MVFNTEGFFEATESWPDWDLNSQPPNIYIYKLTDGHATIRCKNVLQFFRERNKRLYIYFCLKFYF